MSPETKKLSVEEIAATPEGIIAPKPVSRSIFNPTMRTGNPAVTWTIRLVAVIVLIATPFCSAAIKIGCGYSSERKAQSWQSAR